MTPITNTI